MLSLPRLFAVALAVSSAIPGLPAEIFLGQGSLAGEVTATSAILQTRLTRTAGLTEGVLAGIGGVVQFELSETESFANAWTTPWADVPLKPSGLLGPVRLRFGARL